MLSLALLSSFLQQVQGAEVIRVGYDENYGILKTPQIHGFEGYGYEYLQKMLEYTTGDYQFQFVPCSSEEGAYLLRIGMLDMYAPRVPTEAFESQYLFSSESIATDIGFLTSTNPNYVPTGSYSELNHKTIVALKDDPHLEQLQDFILSYQLFTTITEVETSSYQELLESNSGDYLLFSSLFMDDSVQVAFVVSTLDSHLMAPSHMTYLMDDFDQALSQMKESELLLEERLYLKYFDRDYSGTKTITSSDYQLMRMKTKYLVGVSDLNSPLIYLDDQGEIAGIYCDLLHLLAEQMGVAFELVLLHELTPLVDLDNLDFSILSFEDESRLNMKQSVPLLDIPFLAVKHINGEGDSKQQIVGTLDYYGLTQESVEFFLECYDVIGFRSVEEIAIAFQAGKVDTMFVTTSDYNTMAPLLEEGVALPSSLPYSFTPTLSFESSFQSSKIEIINKFIGKLNPLEVDYIILEHSMPKVEDTTLKEILQQYPIFANTFFLMLSAGAMLIWFRERSKKLKLLGNVNRDELTGVLSESCFFQDVSNILARFPDESYSMVSIDMDQFKIINELYGYGVGTRLLVDFSHFLQELEQPPVLLTRCSGDQYLLFMESEDVEMQVQSSLSDNSAFYPRCESYLHSHGGISFSIGVYDIHDATLDIRYMIDCANHARMLGKNEKSTTFYKYSDEMQKQRTTCKEMLTHAKDGLAPQEFVLYFQPLVRSHEKESWMGVEVLVRWNRREKLVPPKDFIPLFEKNGFMDTFDYFVIEQVCAFLAENSSVSLPILWINLSPYTLQSDGFTEKVGGLLEKYQVLPEKLGFELSGNQLIAFSEETFQTIQTLRGQGFLVALDDFGEKSTSFSYISHFDILKLDALFVKKSMNTPKDEKILRHILEMTKELGIKSVAESVETAKLHQFVKGLCVDMAQGFLFHHPMNREKLLQELSKHQVILLSEEPNSSDKVEDTKEIDVENADVVDESGKEESPITEESVVISEEKGTIKTSEEKKETTNETARKQPKKINKPKLERKKATPPQENTENGEHKENEKNDSDTDNSIVSTVVEENQEDVSTSDDGSEKVAEVVESTDNNENEEKDPENIEKITTLNEEEDLSSPPALPLNNMFVHGDLEVVELEELTEKEKE